VSKHIAEFKEWVGALPTDVALIERVIASEAVDRDTRKLLAAGLSYLVMRMDLVPDWEGDIGLLDDVFVLRVCARLASSRGAEGLAGDDTLAVRRLSTDTASIETYLGADLYKKLEAYCSALAGQEIRGRSTDTIVSDAKVRAALMAEVAEDIARAPAMTEADSDGLAVKLKAYLQHKLK
jgi:uncharacterized membrane protein YkvA (DUF1232 family)